MNRFLLLPASCLLILAIAVPALADDDLPNASEFFEEFDANSDGTVTRQEFRGASEIFDLLDGDKDGVIKPAELGLPVDYKPDPNRAKRRPGGEAAARDGRQGKRARRLEELRKKLLAMDVDKDGKVSRAEWKGAPEVFDRLDRNKDGAIDQGDRPARRDRRGDGSKKAGSKKDGSKKGGDKRGGRTEGGDGAPAGPTAEQQKARIAAHFEKLDANGDGKLTADEAPNPRLLEAADANGDGGVTLEEFTAFAGSRRGRQGGGKPRAGRGGPRMSAGMLRRWDRDGDGKVSKDEFPGRDEAFGRYDVDGDGFLTGADVEAAKKDPAPKKPPTTGTGDLIQDCDADGDGRLNRSEFHGTNAEWRALDKDGDGYVTRAELP